MKIDIVICSLEIEFSGMPHKHSGISGMSEMTAIVFRFKGVGEGHTIDRSC